MQYSILELAKLAGVSTRTLRYYDEIGLLAPAKTSPAGYRIYTSAEADLLQQILFYRELEVPLSEIRGILNAQSFDRKQALQEHLRTLQTKRDRMDKLIHTVKKSLAAMEGACEMNDQEKFEGFKEQLIEKNEQAYGEEIRRKYGNDAVDRSNERLRGMSRETYERMQTLEQDVKDKLRAALETGDPAGEAAHAAYLAHKQWLSGMADYSEEYHLALVQMYVDDPRFTAYYDSDTPGAAEFLRKAVTHAIEQNRAGGN